MNNNQTILVEEFTSDIIQQLDIENDKSYRDYNWCLVAYCDIYELKPLLDMAVHYAYILHDKDLCKNNHYHIMLHFENETSFKQITEICNTLHLSGNVFKKGVKDKVKAWEYLTHKNHLDKYQYNECDIITDNTSFWNLKKQENRGFAIIEDILNGVSYLELAKKYGRDFILNHNKYREFAEIIKNKIL